jgi:uncharacterized protein YdeI (YjbR/CyaY-like superfamily)
MERENRPPIRRNAMTVSIRQLHPHFFGQVTGVDLRKPLTPQEARDIEAGMDKYAVLLFRNQDISDDQQLVFARNFGERENARGGTVTKKEDYRLTSGLNDVSNLGKDGNPLPRDHRTHLFQSRQLPVAFRQLVPPDSGEVLAAVGARGQPQGRQYRIRRHARGL